MNTPLETILVVDDTPANLGILFDALETAGYQVRVANSGAAALRGIKRSRPDLILLDIIMPGADGFQICEQLQRDPSTKDIPVIFMTALSETSNEVKGLQSGAVDYITKPFQIESVLARIDTHLTLRRLRRVVESKNEQLEREVQEREQTEILLSEVNEELRQRVEDITTLNLIAQTATLVADLETVLQISAGVITRMFTSSSTIISLVDDANETVSCQVQVVEGRINFEIDQGFRPIKKDSMSEEILQATRLSAQAPVEDDPFLSCLPSDFPLDGVETVVHIPLLARARLIGMISVTTVREATTLTPQEIELAETIAGHIASAIENGRLIEQVRKEQEISESLREVAITLNRTLVIDEVLDRILGQLDRVLHYNSAAIFMHDGDHLVLTRGINLVEVQKGYRLSLQNDDPAVRTYQQRKPIILNDVEQETGWVTPPPSERISSWVSTPLQTQDQVFGVLTLDSNLPNAYRENDAQILYAFGSQAAIAIKNARQVKQTEQAMFEAGLLYRIGNILAKASDSRIGVERALLEFLDAINVDRGAVLTFDGDHNAPVVQAYYDADVEPCPLAPASIHQQVILAGQPIVIPDAPHHPHFTPSDGADICAALMVLPLISRGNVIGVLEVGTVDPTVEFSRQQENLALATAEQMATALENVRLFTEEQKQRQLAESRNRELDAFARTVAHDIKSPLGIIAAYSEFLTGTDPVEEPEQTINLISIIQDHSRKAANIVDELLLLAGVRKQTVPIRTIDTQRLIENALERLSFLQIENKAEVLHPESWPMALGYDPWVEEVWVNYLSNGFKYGGSPPQLRLGADILADGYVCFWVEDNGPGIPSEQQAILFTEFTRLDEIRAEGHGLGLSIVRRIVEKLGGTVGVESTLNHGSRFFFTLPHPTGS